MNFISATVILILFLLSFSSVHYINAVPSGLLPFLSMFDFYSKNTLHTLLLKCHQTRDYESASGVLIDKQRSSRFVKMLCVI
jgi:hypothetical protein